MKSVLWIIVTVLAISVLVSLVRLSRTEDQLRSAKSAEKAVKEFLDKTWPESNEGKLVHLQSLLKRDPLAITVPEQISRCRTYTAEAFPKMEISGEQVPQFTLACLSTAVAITITRGNTHDTAELLQSLERFRASIAETTGRELPSPHEQCSRRAATGFESDGQDVLTTYANCFRETFYFALQHENSALISRFPAEEASAYDRAAEELVRPLLEHMRRNRS